MSATLHPRVTVPRSATSIAEVRGDAVVLTGLALWTIVLALLMWGTWGNAAMDTGYDLVAAGRTAHGELPYVDYTYWYGPVSPLLLGGLFAVFGTGLGPAIALGLVMAAAAIALTYFLAREFTSAVGAGAAAGMVAPLALSGANNSFVLPHATSAPLGVVLALVVLLVLARWSAAGATGHRAPAGAGVVAALVALTRPELAIALYGGLGLWLAARIVLRPGDREGAVRDAVALLAPAIALPLLVYGAFASQVGLGELLTTNLYPRDFVKAAGHVIVDAHAPWTPASVAKLLAHTALYAGGLAALLATGAALRAGGWARKATLAACALAALALLAVLAARPETVRFYLQYAYAWIPAGAWIAAGALLYTARRAGRLEGSAEAVLALVLVLAVATATTYASFLPFPNAAFPEAAVYLLPIAAAFLAWLHATVLAERGVKGLGAAWLALLAIASAGLAIHDARAETTTVRGAHGTITSLPADAPALQGALDTIQRETRSGDPVLLAPQLTSLYTLSGRTDPLRQLSLLPGSLATTADEDEAIARMGDVRLALVNRRPLKLYEHGAFGTTFDRHLMTWLQRDFRRVGTVGGRGQDALAIDIWLRRTP